MRGGLEPLLAVGASKIGERAPLLEPPTQRCLDVAVDVPVVETVVVKLINTEICDRSNAVSVGT